MTSPGFLVVGTITKDITPDGHTLGGTATYSAQTATRLGLRSAIVASVADDMLDDPLLSNILFANVPSDVTTTFRNTYQSSERTQYINAIARPIEYGHVPAGWRTTPIVLLGPLAGDVTEDLVMRLRDRTEGEGTAQIIGASIQGWLRKWDKAGRVTQRHWEGSDILPYLDVAFLSEEDVGHPDLIDVWVDMVPILIVTMGRDGARLHYNGTWHYVPGYPIPEVDPTGAGDVFAAAFLIKYAETNEALSSTVFANCAASFVVEGEGLSSLPTKAQINARLTRLDDPVAQRP